MSEDQIAISVKNVSKTFKLPHEQLNGIKQLALNVFKSGGYETQKVLSDISFEVKKGEFFGIVGRNGSGKSTLLKILAGIYAVDRGDVNVTGTLTPFIELGVGFNPELTGRENVYMNGALLGMSHKQVDEIYKDIVDFAELENFMDQKLKNYSSGMQVRLAFSIAIRAKSDILLFDEVLAVGDASFQQKCYEMFETMKADGQTIILVTHDMSAVQRFCERAIMIDNGKIVFSGDPSIIADRYLEENYGTKRDRKTGVRDHSVYSVENIAVTSSDKPVKSIDLGNKIKISFDVKSESATNEYGLGFQLFNADGTYVFGTNTVNANVPALAGKSNRIEVTLEQNLLPGTYYITVAVMDKKAIKVLRYLPKVGSFSVKQQTKVQGIVKLEDSWNISGGNR
jgi:ABC-type polysaccharide/polyol phosphate transport system ATPase subunit